MLFGLAQSLRSLTASPIASAVQEAHRDGARLEAGGAAISVSPTNRPGSRADSRDFLLPSDVDTNEVARQSKRSWVTVMTPRPARRHCSCGKPAGASRYRGITFCGLGTGGSTSAGAS